MKIDSIDHIVLTVADIEATCAFYEKTLGMTRITFGTGRTALSFGTQKINLHARSNEFDPKAKLPTPGSADICLLTSTPIEDVLGHMHAGGIPVVEGPVRRTGARGMLISVYVRDPDDNLLEIANQMPE